MDAPVASLIVPCRNAAAYLPAALESFSKAADCVPGAVEILCADDGSTDATPEILAAFAHREPRIRVLPVPRRGVSAARNAGLDAARGGYVMFADADDTVLPGWMRAGLDAMERTGADYCRMAHLHREPGEKDFGVWRNRGDYNCSSREDVRRELVSRMIGFSFDDVRRWLAGGGIFDRRELAGVWAGVYRRSVIERLRLRFDENLSLYEDAAFNCAYLLGVSRTTAVDEPLYVYDTRETGSMLRQERGAEGFLNKRKWLEKRRELDAAAGGGLKPMFEASCVFAALRMAADGGASGIPWRERAAAIREYCADQLVADAFAKCPVGWRRPVFSAAVRAVARGRVDLLLLASRVCGALRFRVK